VHLGDEVKSIVDTGGDRIEEDLLEERLAGRPDVVSAEHADREWFVVDVSRELTAAEMMARWIDAITLAHFDLAERLGLPG
jgi:hypothetical protein